MLFSLPLSFLFAFLFVLLMFHFRFQCFPWRIKEKKLFFVWSAKICCFPFAVTQKWTHPKTANKNLWPPNTFNFSRKKWKSYSFFWLQMSHIWSCQNRLRFWKCRCRIRFRKAFDLNWSNTRHGQQNLLYKDPKVGVKKNLYLDWAVFLNLFGLTFFVIKIFLDKK